MCMFLSVFEYCAIIIHYTMDDMSTPIEHLMNPADTSPPPDEPAMSYHDMMRNMNDQPKEHTMPPQHVAQMPPQQHPVSQPAYNHMSNWQPPPQAHTQAMQGNNRLHTTTPQGDDMQRDMIYITVLCALSHSQASHELLLKYIPALFADGRTSVIGSVVIGSMVAGLYVLAKNVSIGVKV